MLENPGDGWCEVVTAFGDRGLVPFNYLGPLPKKAKPAAPLRLIEFWALHDFHPTGDFQVPLRRGEAVTLLENPGDGWCTVVTNGGTKGLVPASYLNERPLPEGSASRGASGRRGSSQGRSSRSASREQPNRHHEEEDWDVLALHVLGVSSKDAARAGAAVKLQAAARGKMAKGVAQGKKAEKQRSQLLGFLVGVSHNTEGEGRALAPGQAKGHARSLKAVREGEDQGEEDGEGFVERVMCCTQPERL